MDTELGSLSWLLAPLSFCQPILGGQPVPLEQLQLRLFPLRLGCYWSVRNEGFLGRFKGAMREPLC